MFVNERSASETHADCCTSSDKSRIVSYLMLSVTHDLQCTRMRKSPPKMPWSMLVCCWLWGRGLPPTLRSARCMLAVKDRRNSCASCCTPAAKCEPILVKFATIAVGAIELWKKRRRVRKDSCRQHASKFCRSHTKQARHDKPIAAGAKQAWHDMNFGTRTRTYVVENNGCHHQCGRQASLAGDAWLQDLWITTRDAARTAVGRAGRSSVEARPARELRRPSYSREVPAACVYWRFCVWKIYTYIATICLLNSACRQGVSLCGQSCHLIRICVSDSALMYIYIYGSCRYCICILYGRSRVLDVYILPLFVYSTLLADRECACVDKVAIWYVYMCLVYVYSAHIATTCLINSACQQGVCVCGQSRYLIRKFVSDIYMYCHYSSTQPCLPTGSVIVWTKSRARYICISVDVVFKYTYILKLFVYLLACWEGGCWCGWSRASMYICIYGYCRYCIYILSLFDIYIYMYCHFRYLIYICFWYIYIYIATTRLLNSACLVGV